MYGKSIKSLTLALLLALPNGNAFAACACGPDFCQDDARVPAALAEKKAALKADGYPDRLIGLLDPGDQCYARITRAPDAFSILMVAPGDTKQEIGWTQQDENLAKAEVARGDLVRFRIYNTRRAFSCCGQPNYDQQSDYDATDDVNTSTAILCRKDGASGVCAK